MSSNYEKIQSSGHNGIKFRNIAILIVCAFIGGSVAAGWAITKYDLFQNEQSSETTNDKAALEHTSDAISINPKIIDSDNDITAKKDAETNLSNQNNNLNDQLINERVETLDNRLSRINVQAQKVSGNTNRTEAMLIAFAARRAIDSGSPLGYIENELRAKFANSNAEDVKAIIEAGKSPVRLSVLQNQLDISSDALLSANADNSSWDLFKKEMRELIVIRKSGSQPPQPERRLARIKTALANRDINTAVAEMERMPGAAKAQGWINLAVRYMRVQNALDAIEKTAINLPRNIISNQPISEISNPLPDSARAETSVKSSAVAPTSAGSESTGKITTGAISEN